MLAQQALCTRVHVPVRHCSEPGMAGQMDGHMLKIHPDSCPAQPADPRGDCSHSRERNAGVDLLRKSKRIQALTESLTDNLPSQPPSIIISLRDTQASSPSTRSSSHWLYSPSSSLRPALVSPSLPFSLSHPFPFPLPPASTQLPPVCSANFARGARTLARLHIPGGSNPPLAPLLLITITRV